jgi:hypothetical protein
MTMAETINAAAKPTITRAMKTNATTTVAAISRNHVRGLRPCDGTSTGDGFEGGGTPPAAPDSDSVFARFRFLANAIGDAEIERAGCQ